MKIDSYAQKATLNKVLDSKDKSKESLPQSFESILKQVYTSLELPKLNTSTNKTNNLKELLQLQTKLYQANFNIEFISKVSESVSSLVKKMGNS